MTTVNNKGSEATNGSVLLIDDDEDLLDILRAWLVHCGYHVLSASKAVDALSLLRRHVVDVTVLDLKMPDVDGLQLLHIIKDLSPATEVIFLSGQGSMDDAIAALKEGKSFDFLQKPLRELMIVNTVIERALHKRRSAEAPRQRVMPPEGFLTERDLAIINLVAEGHDNKEIGQVLALSDKTVRNHLSRLYQKLGVSNRMQAVMRCQSLRLLQYSPSKDGGQKA